MTRSRCLKSSPLLLVALLLLIGARWDARHLYLEAEFPTADSTTTFPAEIVVWFSQVPLPKTTEIHLFDAAKKELKVGPILADSLDPYVYKVAVPDTLRPGVYNVDWSTWSDDEPGGLKIGGQWKFTVIAP
jgi:copper resistance protein C